MFPTSRVITKSRYQLINDYGEGKHCVRSPSILVAMCNVYRSTSTWLMIVERADTMLGTLNPSNKTLGHSGRPFDLLNFDLIDVDLV